MLWFSFRPHQKGWCTASTQLQAPWDIVLHLQTPMFQRDAPISRTLADLKKHSSMWEAMEVLPHATSCQALDLWLKSKMTSRPSSASHPTTVSKHASFQILQVLYEACHACLHVRWFHSECLLAQWYAVYVSFCSMGPKVTGSTQGSEVPASLSGVSFASCRDPRSSGPCGTRLSRPDLNAHCQQSLWEENSGNQSCLGYQMGWESRCHGLQWC